MSTTFYTKIPVDRNFDPNGSNIIFKEDEVDLTPAVASLKAMTSAFKKAEITEGSTVFITVCYSDGTFKGGNFRNDRRTVNYEMFELESGEGIEIVELRFFRSVGGGGNA